MEIKIKYKLRDYYAAIKHNLAMAKADLLTQGKKYEYFVMSVISPFVALIFSIKALFSKLKPTYTFVINNQGIKRSHNDIEGSLTWDRIHFYHETDLLYLLAFTNKGEDSHSHILLPKNYLNATNIKELISYFQKNGIKSHRL